MLQDPTKPQLQEPTLPPVGVETPAESPSGPLWRRIPMGLVLFVGLLAVGAVASWYTSASRSESGEISGSGDLDAAELRVGDCFDFKDPDAEEFDQVAARPCNEEHGYEVFFVGTMPAETFPTDDAFDAYVTSACDPAFAAYVGRSYESSRLELTWVAPTSDLWDSGDHSVQCLLNDPQRPRLTISLQGSNL
jgi:Septum formation